jgi:hypothetical protein
LNAETFSVSGESTKGTKAEGDFVAEEPSIGLVVKRAESPSSWEVEPVESSDTKARDTGAIDQEKVKLSLESSNQ